MYITWRKPKTQPVTSKSYTLADLFNSPELLQKAQTELLMADTENETISPEFYNVTFEAPEDQIKMTALALKYNLDSFIRRLTHLEPQIDAVLNIPEKERYDTFKIPKRSGGYRTINAPKADLMQLLTYVKESFDRDTNWLPHEAAFAYIKTRSTLDAVRRHQQNGSHWFLKIDLKDFFGSCSTRIIKKSLHDIFPFCVLNTDEGTLMDKVVKCATLDNKLPQGTPLSPILSNIILQPFDYHFQKYCWTHPQKLVYTRYADDLLISSKYQFRYVDVQNEIQSILRQLYGKAIKVNTTKTRYGSSNGRNWNLGLMLNKDNQITIGAKNKQRTRAALYSFLKDFTEGKRWSIMDAYHLQGELSYLSQIEPEYATHIITVYEMKTGTNYRAAMKTTLN